jgi:hypothetical protein
MFRGARTIGALVAAEKFHETSLWQIAWVKAHLEKKRK